MSKAGFCKTPPVWNVAREGKNPRGTSQSPQIGGFERGFAGIGGGPRITADVAVSSRGGSGVLYKREPLVLPAYLDAGGLGRLSGRPTAYSPVRLDEVMVDYGNAEYRRVFPVYTAGGPESVRELPVQTLLRVGVAYFISDVGVVYVPAHETLHHATVLPS